MIGENYFSDSIECEDRDRGEGGQDNFSVFHIDR